MGPGSPLAVARVGRDDNRFSLENQPAAVGNDRRLRSIVSELLFTMNAATSTCRTVGARSADVARLGFDEVFNRMWTFYLCYSEAGFRAGYIDVSQLTLARTPL